MTSRTVVSAVAVTVAVATLSLVGCTIPVDSRSSSSTSTVMITSELPLPSTSRGVVQESPSPPSNEPSTSPIATLTTLSVEQVVSKYGGSAGIALVDATGPHSAGPLQSDVAWSTIKVPIALAAARKGTADASLVSAALQSSDNAAAQALWDSLGAPSEAAVATQAEIGVVANSPVVNFQTTRPGFTTFGQTVWSLADQASFGQRLMCHPFASKVTTPMANVVAGQRYGLGTLQGAHFKGGWGPDLSGGYLARQFGYIQSDKGVYGVAIAAKPANGSYETAQAMLTELASISASSKPVTSNPCT